MAAKNSNLCMQLEGILFLWYVVTGMLPIPLYYISPLVCPQVYRVLRNLLASAGKLFFSSPAGLLSNRNEDAARHYYINGREVPKPMLIPLGGYVLFFASTMLTIFIKGTFLKDSSNCEKNEYRFFTTGQPERCSQYNDLNILCFNSAWSWSSAAIQLAQIYGMFGLITISMKLSTWFLMWCYKRASTKSLAVRWVLLICHILMIVATAAVSLLCLARIAVLSSNFTSYTSVDSASIILIFFTAFCTVLCIPWSYFVINNEDFFRYVNHRLALERGWYNLMRYPLTAKGGGWKGKSSTPHPQLQIQFKIVPG